jgi:hypothetical protein
MNLIAEWTENFVVNPVNKYTEESITANSGNSKENYTGSILDEKTIQSPEDSSACLA